MIYYANGCSYTWGGELFRLTMDDVYLPEVPDHPLNKKRLEVVYPYHLGKMINADKVINESMGGGSNARIVRLTLNYFNNLIVNNEDLKNHFVTIQWTEPSRTEYYDAFEDNWILLTTYGPTSDKLPKYNLLPNHKMYYKHFSSDKQDFHSFIMHVYTLGNFFKQHKIPYVFFKHANWDEVFFNNNFITIPDYCKLMGQFNWLNDSPYQYSMHSSGIDTVRGSHPNENGHKQWADVVFKHITEKKILSVNAL